MDYQGTGFAFDSAMDFNFGATFEPLQQSKPAEGNTDAFFFTGDEGIDTTGQFDQSFDMSGFSMQQNLPMGNTLGVSSAWDGQAPINDFTSQPFPEMYTPFTTINSNNKRPLSLDTQDYPQLKRHESEYSFTSPYVTAASSVTASSWALDTTTPSSFTEIGLSEEAADVCSMWFSKYNMLPSDRHIESLCQLTGESAVAIRYWFGQIMKQGHDSAYKSQTSFSQPEQSSEVVYSQDTATTTTSPPPLRGGKKGCTPTTDPELLRRDPSKIYQCTRKCGKRYGRKCDWKRNEEEGYPSKSWQCSLCASQGTEKVKPCFRRYHFSQHFRNIHPGIDSAEFEESSLVQSETAFPRKCGFCTHRFVSRQDRIDHIADHFKQGKCMLDWNDDEDDNNDSDNADDDDYDHKHDSDSSNDTGGSSSGPPSKQAPPGANSRGKDNGDGFNGAYFGGYSQFQLSRDNTSNQGDPSSIIKQHIKPVTADNTSSSSEKPREERAIDNQCAIQGGFSRHDETAQSDESTLAGDDVARFVTDGDAPEISTSQKGDGSKNGSLRLQTPHDQCLNTHVDGIAGRVAAFVKETASSVVDGTSTKLLPTSYPPVLPPDPLILACAFKFLGCSYVTHDQEVWRSHCLSHSSEKGPLGSTGNTPGSDAQLEKDTTHGVICRIKDEQENDRRSFTRLKLEPKEHSETLTPGKMLTATVGCGSVSASMDSTIFSGHRLLAVLADLPHTSASSALFRVDSFLQNIRHCHFRLAAKDWHTLTDLQKLSSTEPLALEHRELVEKLDALRNVLLALGGDDTINTAERTLSTGRDIPSSESYILNRSDNLTTAGLSLESNGLSPAASVFQVDAPLAMIHDSDQVLEKPLCVQPKSNPDQSWHSMDEDKIAKLWNIGLEDYGMTETSPVYSNIEQLLGNDRLPQLDDPSLPDGWTEQNERGLMHELSFVRSSGLDGHASHSTLLAHHEHERSAHALDFHLQPQSFLSVKLLGTGGFSTVDEVVHRETNLRICRKTLKNRDRSAVEELSKEVKILQKLRHPHIIRFLGAYSKGDKVSILLSPVAETTLAVWLDKCLIEKPGGLTDTVVKMFGCLVSSVRYLHEQRPVVRHMDIKPQNILVMYGDSDMPHVILSDFGISSSEDTNEGQSLKPLTRKYVAPEASQRVSRERAADIWSLGCVFLEMLTVGLCESNSLWLDFRNEFSGGEAKYYWQEVPRLHEWLSSCLGQATSHTEATALSTVKLMLSSEPAERPDAVMLTMIFSPAPCCVSWSNDKASFPGPTEELEKVEVLLHGEGTDCLNRLHACKSSNLELELEPFECAKHWLQQCSIEHEACHRQEYNGKHLPTRLVDVRPDGTDGPLVRVVNSADLKLCSDAINYVAVSHAWSSSELTLSTDSLSSMQTAIPRKSLSTSVNDALSAATRIGHRYVWIDSLCVIQDSDEDKKHECESMASTFRDAVLTIVTLDAYNRHASQTMQGTNMVTPVANPINWQTPGFAWNTRAWTLQERLLCNRTLHLAGPQMYWECSTLKASETFPHGLPSLIWEKMHTTSIPTPSLSTQRLRSLTPSPYDHQMKRFAIKSGRNGSTSTHDKDSFKCGFCPGAGEAVDAAYYFNSSRLKAYERSVKHHSRSRIAPKSTNARASANLPRLPNVTGATSGIRAREHQTTNKLHDYGDMDVDTPTGIAENELDIHRN